MQKFGFDKESRFLVNNGAKEDSVEDGKDVLMGREEATGHRGIVARINFTGQDCPDLQYVVKECSRQMSSPMVAAWRRLKKIVRYILGRRSVV